MTDTLYNDLLFLVVFAFVAGLPIGMLLEQRFKVFTKAFEGTNE